MQCLTDQFGWKYYPSLPDGYRLAKLDDFHTSGRKKIGMEYLLGNSKGDQYELHQVTEETTSNKIKPLIEESRVYILKP